jgi:hypothetical protein
MRKITAIGILLALTLVLGAPAPAAGVPADAKKFEKTLPFKSGPQKLDIKVGDVTIDYVDVKGWPDAEDFAKGEKDPNDKKTMWVVYTYTNKGSGDYKCRYAVTIPDPAGGKPWAEDDSTRTLDKGKIDDTNRFGMTMKTVLYKQARTMKLSFEVWKK